MVQWQKNSPNSAGVTEDLSLIPGTGKSSGVGNGNSLQYSCLGNPMDKGDWWSTVRGITESRTLLSIHTQMRQYVTEYEIKIWRSSVIFFPHCCKNRLKVEIPYLSGYLFILLPIPNTLLTKIFSFLSCILI